MIIDAILDRKMDEMDGKNEFNAHNFVKYVEEEAEIFGFKKLEKAAKDDDESEMKAALCEYIDAGGYPANLKEYVGGKYWTLDDDDAEKVEEAAAEIAAGVEKMLPDVMKDISDIIDESTKKTNENKENENENGGKTMTNEEAKRVAEIGAAALEALEEEKEAKKTPAEKEAEEAREEAKKEAAVIEEAAKDGELMSYFWSDYAEDDGVDVDDAPGVLDDYGPGAVDYVAEIGPDGLEYEGVLIYYAGYCIDTMEAKVKAGSPYGWQTWPLDYDASEAVDDIFKEIFEASR